MDDEFLNADSEGKKEVKVKVKVKVLNPSIV